MYIEANRGIYGLPQAGLLANELLEKRLNKRGYQQSKSVTVFGTNNWRPVQFTLVVDNFGVEYVGEEHALHLKHTIEDATLASRSTRTTREDNSTYQCHNM